MKKYLSRGFTLVELLIVIALLGVIATIVIAAINPIEQANKAADAGMKADASQLLSSIERYYASHNDYPWNECTGSGCTAIITTGPDTAVNFVSADTAGYGLCTVTGKSCKAQTVQGTLIDSLELQTAFLSKSWIGATGASGTVNYGAALMIGKGGSASAQVYVCWAPKSTSNKQNLLKTITDGNSKLVDTTKNWGSALTPTYVSSAPSAGLTDTCWKTGACMECVPE